MQRTMFKRVLETLSKRGGGDGGEGERGVNGVGRFWYENVHAYKFSRSTRKAGPIFCGK